MKTVDVRVHNAVEPVLIRIVLPKRSERAKTPAENFGPGSVPLLSATIPIQIEVREAQPVGRPVKVEPIDLAALLPADGLAYADWLRAARDSGVSESTFKRLLRRCGDVGLVHKVAGKYLRPEGP